MLDVFFRRRRPPPVADVDSLARFLDQRAALIAQKSIIGYCQVKTNLPIHELMVEKPFAEAFERARWEGYAAVLADLVVIVEGRLRGGVDGATDVLLDRLAALFGRIIDMHPQAATLRPHGWSDDVAALRARLAEVQDRPPRAIAEISCVSAGKLFRSLPIHDRLRRPDAPAVEAGVRFLFVGLAREFDRDFDRDALARTLLAEAPPSAAGAEP